MAVGTMPPPRDAAPGGSAGDEAVRSGVALCLSGGGYAAMVFQLGVLWRLNEAGWLAKLDQVSAVSGGAVTACLLGLRWERLAFDSSGVARAFVGQVVEPVRELTRHAIDTAAIIGGAITPGSISGKLLDAYRRHLFGDATLADLPDRPRFVVTATSVQSGSVWTFAKGAMGDPRVGEVPRPRVELTRVAAASSAVPPFFSPVTLELDAGEFLEGSGHELHCAPYTTDVVLTNGGFLDKLAVEDAWQRWETVLVSDGGARFRDEPEPRHDWLRHTQRVLELVDRVERQACKTEVIEAFRQRRRKGAYWGMRSAIEAYEVKDALPCPPERTLELQSMPSRLKRLQRKVQERLVNWGYAIADAALRRHLDPGMEPPAGFPYRDAGV